MASQRPQRFNAGRNIGKLINQEIEGDDFYSTAYGGFEEESEDEEYETEASEDDRIDSDFDVDETEWGPDEDAEEKVRKEERKKKNWIKPFKRLVTTKHNEPKKGKRLKTKLIVTSSTATPSSPPEQRTFRKSTQETSKGFRQRMEEESMRKKRVTRRPKVLRKLTQEELLEEAKLTEIENLASLEAYARMEEEKKKVREKPVVRIGPVVRYISVTMPIVSEISDEAPVGGDNRSGPELISTSSNDVPNSIEDRKQDKPVLMKEDSQKCGLVVDGAIMPGIAVPMETNIDPGVPTETKADAAVPMETDGKNVSAAAVLTKDTTPTLAEPEGYSKLLLPIQSKPPPPMLPEPSPPPIPSLAPSQAPPQVPPQVLPHPPPQAPSQASLPPPQAPPQASLTPSQASLPPPQASLQAPPPLPQAPTSPPPPPPSPNKYSRNFLVFTDTNNFPSAYFPTAKPVRKKRRLCPVTGLPAKYIDPLTHTPYATPFAFKIIRMRYVSEAEQKCERRLMQLSNWLEEKKKKKKMEAT